MYNLKQKLVQFMYGRYGIDTLYYVLLALYVFLIIINMFLHSWIVSILEWGILILASIRFFSRNIDQRRHENQIFLQGWSKVKAWFKLTFRKIKDIKTKRYRKCPNCHTVLRLPNKKGNHSTTCPRCRKEFKVKIRI